MTGAIIDIDGGFACLVVPTSNMLEIDFNRIGLRDDVVHRRRASIDPSIFKIGNHNACTNEFSIKAPEAWFVGRASGTASADLIQERLCRSRKGWPFR